MYREMPKIKMQVSYVYADGPEQQRALEILTEMLRDAAARYRRQQAESISQSTPSDPVLDPKLVPQAPDKYPTSTQQTSDKLKLLKFCVTPRAMREMLPHMGLKDRETFMTNYLHPLIRAKLLAMTHPDSRRSPKQKYVTTHRRSRSDYESIANEIYYPMCPIRTDKRQQKRIEKTTRKNNWGPGRDRTENETRN